MKTVAIVQARMTSTRLPGKVLAELAGRPMLAWLIERVQRATTIDQIVVATTVNATDDALATCSEQLGVEVFRGDEFDVLERYRAAAARANADIVVRITADCPLIDPDVVDRVVTRVRDDVDRCDYASNTIVRSFPRGLDVEAFHRAVLERMAHAARSKPAREHVTYFLHREHPEMFTIASIVDSTDNSDLRWTVDTVEDLELVRQIYARARLPERWLPYADLVAVVRGDPDLLVMNAQVHQKAE